MKVRVTLDFDDEDRRMIADPYGDKKATRNQVLRWVAAVLQADLETRFQYGSTLIGTKPQSVPDRAEWIRGWKRWVRGYDEPDTRPGPSGSRAPSPYVQGWRAAAHDNDQGGGERPKLAEGAEAYDDAFGHTRKRNPRNAWDLGPLLAVEYIRPDEPDTIYKHQFAGRGLTPDPGYERPTLRVDDDALYVVGGSYHVDPDLGIVDDEQE